MHPLNSGLLLLHLALQWLEWWSGGSAGTRTLGWIGVLLRVEGSERVETVKDFAERANTS